MVCTRTSRVPCWTSQRRSLSNDPVVTRVLNSITPQKVIQSTFHIAGGGAVEIGAHAVAERHLPDPKPEQEGDDRADQHGKPGRHAQPGKQEQQQHNRNQRDQPGHEQISGRIENLRKHRRFPPITPCVGVYRFDVLARCLRIVMLRRKDIERTRFFVTPQDRLVFRFQCLQAATWPCGKLRNSEQCLRLFRSGACRAPDTD